MSNKRTERPVYVNQRFADQQVLPLGVLVLLFLLPPGAAGAQSSLSTIRGTVTDQSSGRVPAAEVTVTDKGTNLARSTVTDDQGNFEVSNLKPGLYRMQVHIPGFKTFAADNILLDSSQVRRLDAQLEVGEVTGEVLTVDAAAAVIEKEEAKLSGSVDAKAVQTSPVVASSHWNPHYVLLTLPGVQPSATGHGISVTGTLPGNGFTMAMDGAQQDSTFNFIENVEDVEEVKITVANNTADVSRAGYFNLISKRGGNSLHGNAFYYHQNSALNARPYFAPTKTSGKYHTYGASVGGAIKKDRTFFYASYNGAQDPSTTPKLSTVPTEKMRTGDFSELGTRIIRDPVTGAQFSGNIIPENRLSPTALKVQAKYMAQPSKMGTSDNLDWISPDPVDLYRVDYATFRLDHQLLKNNELFGRFSKNWIPYVLPSTNLPGFDWTWRRVNWQMTLSDTHIFSPTLIHNFRFGWYRFTGYAGGTRRGFTPLQGQEVVQELGLTGVNPRNATGMGFPNMAIAGYPTLTVNPEGWGAWGDMLHFADTITWNKGKHVWKFGADFRPSPVNPPGTQLTGTFGSFSFDGSFTGYSYADFLLGIPRTSSRNDNPTPVQKYRSTELGFYATDTFKVNTRLTLDYGLRWDFFFPGKYDHGLQYNWDPTTGNVVVTPAAMEKLHPLYPANITVVPGEVIPQVDGMNLAPRLGAAFRINDQTVLRGAYGIFTEYPGPTTFMLGGGPINTSWSETFTNSISGGAPLFAFPDPFPAFTSLNVPSRSVSGYPMQIKNGYIQQFNLSFEREVGKIGFRISYAGSRSRGMTYNLNLNKPRPSDIPFAPARNPWPQFTSASFYQTDGALNYNGLTLRALRRTGHFTFDAHWTWAKNMSNYLNLENPYDHLQWNRDQWIPNHRVVLNSLWRIPVGRGERFLADSHPSLNHVLSNWSVSYLGIFQTGTFFSPSFSGSGPVRNQHLRRTAGSN